MIEKRLGKIDFVEFGSMKDYPFQLGLQLGFSMSGIGDMHAQSLIKFMKERGDSDCPGTTEKTQRDILIRPPIRP